MTTTPITKEALIELGFKKERDDVYSIESSKYSRNLFIFFKKGEVSDSALYQHVGSDYLEECELETNIKTIEQLKTIIEVCL